MENNIEKKIEKKTKIKTKIKTIYIYRESKLPYRGWIQSCFNCYIFTERNILFKTKFNEHTKTLYEFNVFLCPLCQREIIKKNNILLNIKLQNKCNNYLKYYY